MKRTDERNKKNIQVKYFVHIMLWWTVMQVRRSYKEMGEQ